jgi:hypothetical protein
MDTVKQLGEWLAIVVGVAGLLAGFVTALVALVKTTIPGLPANYYPAIAVFLGTGIGGLSAYLVPYPLAIGLCGGFVGGLLASGLYRGAVEAALAHEESRTATARDRVG